MARVLITVNLNDASTNPKPVAAPLPATGNEINITGGEINAAELTSDNFDGSGSATISGPAATKLYGTAVAANAMEARFLSRRHLGLC